jgi:hypothetical protein
MQAPDVTPQKRSPYLQLNTILERISQTPPLTLFARRMSWLILLTFFAPVDPQEVLQ